MLRVNPGEQFPIVVSLVDESTSSLATGQTVQYTIRNVDDTPLVPDVSGTLVESTVEAGIYKKVETVYTPGPFIIYATCPGFLTNTEDLMVNQENIYDLAKQNRHYNTSVEDVTRTNAVPTASQ